MEQLFGIDKEPHRKLNQVGLERWSRAHSPVNRYNYLTSNCVESVNVLSREARKMPITMLIEFFRGLVQRSYFERRSDAAKYEELGQKVTPYAEKRIHRRILKSNRWNVHGISRTQYQVRDRRNDCHVNLTRRECSCLKWKHSGLPCGHVIAVLKEIGIRDCAELAENWFTIDIYKATYVEEINFVGDVSNWVIPENFMRVLPPKIIKRNAGRPKSTARIPSRGETTVKVKVCTRCGSQTHKNSQCGISMTSTQSFVMSTQSSLYKTVDLNQM
ncbi:uncharacterized protein [Rutidosis leptorrhynchoides]|uniref:uncharacterized protein n=1 Tax=Rutidosis leptorrhynchoides TaxID=125765 RepID=UPI003A999688